jgi:hypothetical protein
MASLRSVRRSAAPRWSDGAIPAACLSAFRLSKRWPGRPLERLARAWATEVSNSLSVASRSAFRSLSASRSSRQAVTDAPAASTTSSTPTALARPATAGLRRHQRQRRSIAKARRAVSGSSARKRRRSSASASADW